MEAKVLSWKEWWRRHEFLFTHVSKKGNITTGEEGPITMSPQIQLLVTDLLKTTRDDYFDVRAASCIALGKLGQNTPEVRTKLVAALKDRGMSHSEAQAPPSMMTISSGVISLAARSMWPVLHPPVL